MSSSSAADEKSSSGKVKRVLVTGANKGIGLACVERILDTQPDAYVFLGSRDQGRGEAALAGLLKRKPAFQGRVSVLQLDVCNVDSVRKAAAHVKDKFGEACLYGVLNNAGGAHCPPKEMFQLNVLGPKLVVDTFLPLIQPKGGRIANVSSGECVTLCPGISTVIHLLFSCPGYSIAAAGPTFVSKCSAKRQAQFLDPNVKWADIQGWLDSYCSVQDNDYESIDLPAHDAMHTYGMSKACLNSYTMLLAKAHPNLHVNSCTPGFIATDLVDVMAKSRGHKSGRDMGAKPPSAGTVSPLFLLFGNPPGNGRFYGSDAKRSPLHKYRDPGTAEYNPDNDE